MHVSPFFKEINRRFVRMDNSMWGCPSYRSKRWSLALGMTQNHVSIPSLRQPTQDTWMSLWGPESEPEILCFATAHGRTGVLSETGNGQAHPLTAAICHRPGGRRALLLLRVWREHPLSCTSSSAALSLSGQKHFSSGFVFPHYFVCSGWREFVFLEPGCCRIVSFVPSLTRRTVPQWCRGFPFVLSLSRMAQTEDGPSLCPCSPGQLAGSPPESWIGVEQFAFVLLFYCCYLLVNCYFFTYISSPYW